VSTTPADPPEQLYDLANLTVELPKGKRTNIYYRVRLVKPCVDTDVTLLGALAWVATDGEEVSISGPYVGATCRAWVYDTAGRRTDPSKAVSNVVTFQG
jgi:hypothetical protein